MELANLAIHEAHDLLRAGQISSFDLTRAALDRIRASEPSLGAFLTVAEDEAMRQANVADERFRRGENVTSLTGIPFAVKDCLCTRGIRTTCASRILRDYVPPYDATTLRRLADSGAVLVGKCNMDEFGMGSSCENSAFFPTHNPWSPDRVPGGSSGGSAAAVAAGEVTFTLGEDTGGSIRMPAAFCGVVGVKPTYGLVSRYGLIALASSFDSIGPLARHVRDTALVLAAIAGHDPLDSTSLHAQVPDYSAGLEPDLRGLRLGTPVEYFAAGMQPGVEKALREAIRQLRELGAEIVEVSLPNTRYAIPVYYLILFAEASANLARFDGIRFGSSAKSRDVLGTYLATRNHGFGQEVKRRIMLGTYVLSVGHYDAYYLRAQKVRALLRRDFLQAFARCDALVTPVCPTTAFRMGEKIDDPLAMYLSDVYVTAINTAGVPAMSVPCGFADGLPVGMQLIGPPLGEPTLFRVGHAYQTSTAWHLARPHQEKGP